MYYVTETNYVGPNKNDDRYCDADFIEISTSPAVKNLSREVCTDGWCGTTNDWALYAHGEFETEQAAREFIQAKWAIRDDEEFDPRYADDGVIARFKIGALEQLSRQRTEDWIYAAMQCDVTADTTDEKISELADEYESSANADGVTLESVEEIIEKFRDEKRAERDEDEDEDD